MGIGAVHGNPYDGATLQPALAQVQRLTGQSLKQVLVDRGFRGQTHHPEDVAVLLCGQKQPSSALKRLLRRRSALEPVIGHSKADPALGRNYLQGQAGDRMNALLVGCGFNLRKLCRFLASPVADTAPSPS